MRLIAVAAVCLAAPATPGIADVQYGDSAVECYCTDSSGGRVELGESICLFVDGRSFVAICEMSQNNPIWRDTGEDCVMSRYHLDSIDPAPA